MARTCLNLDSSAKAGGFGGGGGGDGGGGCQYYAGAMGEVGLEVGSLRISGGGGGGGVRAACVLFG